MSKGGLSFLLKKSWHTGKLSNVEKVWKAEKKSRDESKKLDQLKKEIDQERQREELRELQREAGLLPNTHERMNWMVAGPAAASEHQKEQYLLGKEFLLPAEEQEETLQKIKANNGPSSKSSSDWVEKYENRDADALARIREDPLLLMKAAEKAERDKVVKNPFKMRKLKEEVEKERKLKGRKRTREPDADSGRDYRHSFEVDEAKAKKYGLSTYSGRGKAEDRERRHVKRRIDRSRSKSYEPQRSYSKDRLRDRRQIDSCSPSPHRDSREHSYHRQYEGRRFHSSESESPRYSKDRSSNRYGSNRDSQSSRNSSSRTRKLASDEREAKLRQMQLDAHQLEEERMARIKMHAEQSKQDDTNLKSRRRDEMQSVPFLKEMSEKVFLGSEDTLQDRLSRNKHYLLRGHEVRGEDV